MRTRGALRLRSHSGLLRHRIPEVLLVGLKKARRALHETGLGPLLQALRDHCQGCLLEDWHGRGEELEEGNLLGREAVPIRLSLSTPRSSSWISATNRRACWSAGVPSADPRAMAGAALLAPGPVKMAPTTRAVLMRSRGFIGGNPVAGNVARDQHDRSRQGRQQLPIRCATERGAEVTGAESR